MDMFEKAMKTAKEVGGSVINSAKNLGGNIYNATKEQSELAGLNIQKTLIEKNLNEFYANIGKKYIEYMKEGNGTQMFDVTDIICEMEPELDKLDDVNRQIAEKEQFIKNQNEERLYKKAKDEFESEKAKLDRAFEMDIITKYEYEEKLAMAQKKLDNYDILRKIQLQFEMGIITKDEYDEKVKNVLS